MEILTVICLPLREDFLQDEGLTLSPSKRNSVQIHAFRVRVGLYKQIAAWKALCTGFSHSLVKYQKSHSFAVLTPRPISDNLTTGVGARFP